MLINRRDLIIGVGAFALSTEVQAAPQVRLGIILVGLSWCPYCKNAAALLYHSTPLLGVPVLIASKDNRPITPYTEFVSASQHPIADQIMRVPTTLFYQPDEERLVDMIEGFRDPRRYLLRVKRVVQTAIKAGYVD